MTEITLEHFKRAISDISANGDNDTLPFDLDNRFISENQEELANIAFGFSEGLENPRLNLFVKFSFDEIISVIGGGRSKVELVELFSAILGIRSSAKS
jgi:hypothetical protein